MIPVMIDGTEQNVTIPEIFEHLNYHSYKAHRERLRDWSAERVQLMFVKLGIGNLTEVRRWEERYLEEQRHANL